MRIIIFVLSILVLASCGGKKEVVKKETPPERKTPIVEVKKVTDDGVLEFLDRFESVVLKHDMTAAVDLMDKDYKKEQHDKFHKGNSEQFLNSFFCDYQTNGQGFKCIKFNEILELKRIEIMPNDGNFTVVYHITGKGGTIKKDLLILVKKENAKTVYGFFGPLG